MGERPTRTWREAFMASPGPQSPREALWLALKGLCMGAADVVPGVSGGTVALITGIYAQLVRALRSFDGGALGALLHGDVKGALARVHLRFLATLLAGIGTAILSLARLMHYLLQHQPVPTWSLFFGLIAASILVVGRRVHGWRGAAGLCFIAGALAASAIVNLVPLNTPEALWFIFVCGMVAICAMILPGISGAFILLILGKYAYITGTLKNPFLPGNLLVIAVFCAGCAAGLLAFSRLLNWLLSHHENATLGFLTGLMAGSLQRIWPWKSAAGTGHLLWGGNVLPAGWGPEVLWAVLLAAAGFAGVLAIERLSRAQVAAGR